MAIYPDRVTHHNISSTLFSGMQDQNAVLHTSGRKYNARVLQLEDQQRRLIRIHRYSEAKDVLANIRELKRKQDLHFEQARKNSQELERSHLVKNQSRERKVLRARLQDEKQKVLVAKREAIELCVRRYQAQVGRTQQKHAKQKTKLQVLHPVQEQCAIVSTS
jgi:hypothetical protein